MKSNKLQNRPTIGLALGSGGPLGLSHIGVIKALVEANIPIDYIAGSSIGSLVGGFYALDKHIRGLEELSKSTDWHKLMFLIDPSIKLGLIKGEKWEKFLRDKLGFVKIEDLKIPLTVVATDLNAGEVVCIKKGDLVEAIRASTSIPLIFQPVVYKDYLLADGGLSMPVPVSVVREMGADIVIAVNVNADLFDHPIDAKFGFVQIANNSIKLLEHHLSAQNSKDADVIINTHSRRGGIIEEMIWDTKELIVSGEKYAQKVLPEIKSAIANYTQSKK